MLTPQEIEKHKLIQVEPLGERHFVARFGRPGRVEVLVHNGELVAHIYEDVGSDLDQEPLGAFDSTLVTNEEWTL